MGERALQATTKFALETNSLTLQKKALEARRKLLEQAKQASIQNTEIEATAK